MASCDSNVCLGPSSSEQASQRTEKETIERNIYVVVKRLRDLKISDEKSNELAYRYSDYYIEEKIELLEWKLAGGTVGRPIKDTAAWLIKAIENDYKPPKGFKTLAELERESEAERLMQEELEIEFQAEREMDKKHRDRIIESYQIPDNFLDVWEKILEGLKADESYKTLVTRLEGSFLLSIEDGLATILVEDSDNQKWLEDRAKSILATRFSGVFGEHVKIIFMIIES